MEFSRCSGSRPRPAPYGPDKAAPAGGLSKLNSVEAPRSTFVLGEPGHPSPGRLPRSSGDGLGAHRGNGPGIPRKEVIQPQLPLRLPCYDFTPVTDPTFDGSLPCGLGHRLRVLPASVV